MPTVHVVTKPCPEVLPATEEWTGWDYRFSAYERVIYRLHQLSLEELGKVWVEVTKLLSQQ